MQKKKIIFLPLDGRPCNYNYPKMLLEENPEYELLIMDKEELGYKKLPAKLELIDEFLKEKIVNADIVILSMDMFLYGGLLYSRIHNYSKDFLSKRLELIKTLKKMNSKVKIYAFTLIMRCPTYSSSEEEPDYYAKCGREIYLLGEYMHKQSLGLFDNEIEINRLKECTKGYIDDYLQRRSINLDMNCKVIDLVGEYIDYLIIPQDDSSPYGFIALDQTKIRHYVIDSRKQKQISIYPGADEIGLTLLARAIQTDKNIRIKVKTDYSSSLASSIIPLYEDRILGESIKCQIQAANCIETDNDIDCYLMVNCPSDKMVEAIKQNRNFAQYDVNRSLNVFVDKIDYMIENGKKVAIADVAYANGGDLNLGMLLDDYCLYDKIIAYAGWNTAANTLGTTIACAVFSLLFPSHKIKQFIALRFYEDIGFCSCSRAIVSKKLDSFNCSYYNLEDKNNDISKLVLEETQKSMKKIMPQLSKKFQLTKCSMPWNRMFEVDLSVIFNKQ